MNPVAKADLDRLRDPPPLRLGTNPWLGGADPESGPARILLAELSAILIDIAHRATQEGVPVPAGTPSLVSSTRDPATKPDQEMEDPREQCTG